LVKRRDFISGGAATVAFAAQTELHGRIESVGTISRHPDYYHGWPTVTSRHNGEIVLTYSGGREAHVCPFGRLELIRSHDGGRHWSWPVVLWDSPIDDRDSGVLETPSGSLLVTTFTSLAYEELLKGGSGWPAEKLSRWQAVNLGATPEQRRSLLDTWMLRSTDGGMTWSAPYRVPVSSPHGPTGLADGRLLYAGKQLWRPGTRVGVCESLDDGKSWVWLSDIPTRRSDRVEQYHEPHAVQAADGRIIVHIRNHNPQNQGETLQTESADGGRTWATPHSIGVWGLPSHLLRLRDGRLLMTYGYRREPFGNQARISADHGATWSEPITISDDGAGGDLGYPSSVELEAGQFLTVWYELLRGSPHAVLRQARWAL
jgi:sialidase-1